MGWFSSNDDSTKNDNSHGNNGTINNHIVVSDVRNTVDVQSQEIFTVLCIICAILIGHAIINAYYKHMKYIKNKAIKRSRSTIEL